MIFQITKIFFLLLSITSFSLNSQEMNAFLEYSIHPHEENGKFTLLVGLKFQGNDKGITEILLPSSWAGQNELYLEIENLHCISSHAAIEDTEDPKLKKVYYSPNEVVQLFYQVTTKTKPEIQWYYRPIIEDSHFFFIGHCFFIVPKIDDRNPIAISLEWQNFPDHWSLANSFGNQNQKQELFLPISTFLHAVYVGGDFQILKCGKEDTPIFIAIRGAWSFSSERLIHLVETVIKSHRDFWNDNDFPYYLVTVIPTGDDHFMGGTGLFRSFSIFIGDLSEDDEDDWKWLAWLLSHEHFHTWNGIKMMSSHPESSLFWFTEGFTEYYAVKLNYHSKLLSLDDYIEHINTIMYDYYGSSVHNEPNQRIQKDFWNDWDVQRLPYVRGFLFALNWDQKIQNTTSGQYSLDNFMLALIEKAQENLGKFSLGDIEQVASIFLPADVVRQDLKNYIFDGATLFPKNNFDKNYSLTWTDHIGFDLFQTITKQKIKGVKQRSRAFEAGLRNGQKYINHQKRGEAIVINILDYDGNIKEIIYLKEVSDRMIPQYVWEEAL